MTQFAILIIHKARRELDMHRAWLDIAVIQNTVHGGGKLRIGEHLLLFLVPSILFTQSALQWVILGDFKTRQGDLLAYDVFRRAVAFILANDASCVETFLNTSSHIYIG